MADECWNCKYNGVMDWGWLNINEDSHRHGEFTTGLTLEVNEKQEDWREADFCPKCEAWQ